MMTPIKIITSLLRLIACLLAFTSTQAQTLTEYVSSGKQKSEARVYTAAIDDFTYALRINDKSEDAYYERGVTFYKMGRFIDALSDLNKAIELAPQLALSYYWRGKVQMKLHDFRTALWDFNKAISLSDNQADFYVEKAFAHLSVKHFVQAQDACKSAFQINPLYPPALSALGLVYLEQDKLEEAYEYLKKAVNLQSSDAQNHFNLAEYFFKINEREKAIDHYTSSINLDPYNPEAYFKRAILKLALGSDLEAQKDANRAILHNRRFYKAYVVRGIASYNMREMDRHDGDFNQYLSVANSSEDYYFLATNAYLYSKEQQLNANEQLTPKAEVWAQKALQISESYENQLLYAQVLAKLKKTSAALEAAQKALNLAKKLNKDTSESKKLIAELEREKIDSTPPVIRIFAPLATTRGIIVVETANKITVVGQANDESGVTAVLINGNPARLMPDGNFDGEATLIGENSMITVRAIDSRGNEAKTTFQVNKSNTNKPIAATQKKRIEGKRRALLFATDLYDTWGHLSNPVNDAKTIAADLKEIYDYEVEVLTNLRKNDIILKIKEYAQFQYGPNDQLLIFFAGHGQFDEIFKEGYVVAKDSDINDESKSSYIAHSNLRTYISNINCKQVLLMMDVCFGGTIDPLIAMRGSETNFDADREELIRRKMRLKSKLYLTSGGKEYVPDGRPGQHSPFCRRLLEAFRSEGGTDGILTMGEIMEFIGLVNPTPRLGELGQSDPGADFLFFAR